jgi:uncharacterized membrane protein YcaP (DUF421 family)
MDMLVQINWQQLLVPTVALGEMVLRGSLVYLLIFALMRLTLKREAGTLTLPDLLMVVLIADAAQNAMTAEYRSVPEGLVLVVTIIFWNYALDWLASKSPRFERWVQPPPLLLVKDGCLLRRNMRQELLTEDELMSQLRQQGCEDLAQVKRAYMEGDGRISVIRATGDTPNQAPRRPIS